MKIHIENIGKLKSADVELNGITVICGENNTGKSTVGKALHCAMNSCYNLEEKTLNYLAERAYRDSYNVIFRECRRLDPNNDRESFILGNKYIKRRPFSMTSANRIFIEISDSSEEEGIKKLIDFYKNDIEPEFVEMLDLNELMRSIYQHTQNLFHDSVDKFAAFVVEDYFRDVFNGQIININSNEALVTAELWSHDLKIGFSDAEGLYQLHLNEGTSNRSIFIDSPFEYKIDKDDWRRNRDHTLESLANNDSAPLSDLESYESNEAFKIVNTVFKAAITGRFINERYGTPYFQFDGMKKAITVGNLSTGVSAMLLFRTLCEKGMFKEGDALILDEPEIHLHPQWQLVYAEAIVLLQRELNLTVLVTTHSPFFIEAFDTYCQKYKREKQFKYYLAENTEDGSSVINDVTDELDKIFKKMNDPLLRLDGELC